MAEVSIENLIQLVTQEVIRQLKAKGVNTAGCCNGGLLHASVNNAACARNKTEYIDMSKYKTPVLTERHIDKLHELTGRIIVPKGTIITPKARETSKRKQIDIEFQ